jgi:hypothetical protein
MGIPGVEGIPNALVINVDAYVATRGTLEQASGLVQILMNAMRL